MHLLKGSGRLVANPEVTEWLQQVGFVEQACEVCEVCGQFVVKGAQAPAGDLCDNLIRGGFVL